MKNRFEESVTVLARRCAVRSSTMGSSSVLVLDVFEFSVSGSPKGKDIEYTNIGKWCSALAMLQTLWLVTTQSAICRVDIYKCIYACRRKRSKPARESGQNASGLFHIYE